MSGAGMQKGSMFVVDANFWTCRLRSGGLVSAIASGVDTYPDDEGNYKFGVLAKGSPNLLVDTLCIPSNAICLKEGSGQLFPDWQGPIDGEHFIQNGSVLAEDLFQWNVPLEDGETALTLGSSIVRIDRDLMFFAVVTTPGLEGQRRTPLVIFHDADMDAESVERLS